MIENSTINTNEKRTIPYVNFRPQTELVYDELIGAVGKVLKGGNFVLGTEVSAFEKEAAQYCQSKYAIGVSNGTDALILAMQALNIGPGDEVITTANSFVATATAICMVGATPVFVDVREDLNMNWELIEKAITKNTKAIMPVHLTGRSARMHEIMEVAKKHGLSVIEDAAQAMGAKVRGKPVGSMGTIAGFSMHPLKNLHTFGDGGLVTTNDEELYTKICKLRNLGLKSRDECEFIAGNKRLDEIQAAMVRINLRHLDQWTKERHHLAMRYNSSMPLQITPPIEMSDEDHVYQTYVVLAEQRDQLHAYLLDKGIDAKVHYPRLLTEQPAIAGKFKVSGDLKQTIANSKRILSLPLYPGLSDQDQEYILHHLRMFYAR